jgi:hypothetical protein
MSSKIKSSVPSGDDHDCALNHGYCGCGLHGGAKRIEAQLKRVEISVNLRIPKSVLF